MSVGTHESFLVYRRFRYLKWAVLLCLVAISLYAWHQPIDPPNGGTWLGYGLGTISAGLIVWLMWLGIRKRRYSSSVGTVKGWLSAHVYLGLSLLILATLHTGLQFGWNVHTVAYTLMIIVIVSGVVGTVLYRRYPKFIAANRAGRTTDVLLAEIQELDEQIIRAAENIPATLANTVDDAVKHTAIGGGWLTQLKGRDHSTVALGGAKRTRNTDQRALIEWLAKQSASAASSQTAEANAIQKVLTLCGAKRRVCEQLRKDMRFHALLDIWLYIHVPISFGLLAALTIHIVSVFLYW